MGSSIPLARIGDTGSGHDAYEPTVITSCSDNVFANNKGVARVDDTLLRHKRPNSNYHDRKICKGSNVTFVNNRGVARIGDPICCGGLLVQGSPNVFKG